MPPAPVDERLVELFLEVTAIEGLSGQERDGADHVARYTMDLFGRPTRAQVDQAVWEAVGFDSCAV